MAIVSFDIEKVSSNPNIKILEVSVNPYQMPFVHEKEEKIEEIPSFYDRDYEDDPEWDIKKDSFLEKSLAIPSYVIETSSQFIQKENDNKNLKSNEEVETVVFDNSDNEEIKEQDFEKVMIYTPGWWSIDFGKSYGISKTETDEEKLENHKSFIKTNQPAYLYQYTPTANERHIKDDVPENLSIEDGVMEWRYHMPWVNPIMVNTESILGYRVKSSPLKPTLEKWNAENLAINATHRNKYSDKDMEKEWQKIADLFDENWYDNLVDAAGFGDFKLDNIANKFSITNLFGPAPRRPIRDGISKHLYSKKNDISPFRMIHAMGPDFMKNKFEAILVWGHGDKEKHLSDFTGTLNPTSIGFAGAQPPPPDPNNPPPRNPEASGVNMHPYEKSILSREGFAVRFGEIQIPSISNEEFVWPILETQINKIRSSKVINRQASFTFRLDQNLIWLDKINELASHKNTIDTGIINKKSISMGSDRPPENYLKGRSTTYGDPREWRKVIRVLAQSWPQKLERNLRDPSDRGLCLVINMRHLSNWIHTSSQQKDLPFFVFEDIRILGTSDAINYERESGDIQNITINFIFKRCYQITEPLVPLTEEQNNLLFLPNTLSGMGSPMPQIGRPLGIATNIFSTNERDQPGEVEENIDNRSGWRKFWDGDWYKKSTDWLETNSAKRFIDSLRLDYEDLKINRMYYMEYM